MTNIFKRMSDWIAVHQINRAMYHNQYKTEYFLCTVINNTCFPPTRTYMRRRVRALIGGNSTLRQHIWDTMLQHGYTRNETAAFCCQSWAVRRPYHILFWEKAKQWIIDGKEGPVQFNPKDLGIYKKVPMEKQHD